MAPGKFKRKREERAEAMKALKFCAACWNREANVSRIWG